MNTPEGSAAPAPSGAPDCQLDPYAETLAELSALQRSARLRTAAGMAQLTARFCKLRKRIVFLEVLARSALKVKGPAK